MTVNIIGKEESGKLINLFFVWQNTKAKYTDSIILVKHENEHHTFGNDAEMLSTLIGIETEKDTDERITFRLPCFYTD